jgi:acetyl esterase/lipase
MSLSWQARLLNPVLKYAVKPVLFPRVATPLTMQLTALAAAGLERVTPSLVKAHITPVRTDTFTGEWVEPDQPTERVLLYFHGGGYMIMSPRGYRDFTATLAQALPARVLAVDYRQGGRYPWPAPLYDAMASYLWLLDQGIAPENILIGGDSAGGHLALSTLLAIRDDELPSPRGAIALSPWTNMACDFVSHDANRDSDVLLNLQAVRSNAAFQCQGDDPHSPANSPAFADFTGLPPLFITASTSEILLDDARAARDRALEAGVAVTLREYDHMPHVFQILQPFLPEARAALAELTDFVDDLFRRPPGR